MVRDFAWTYPDFRSNFNRILFSTLGLARSFLESLARSMGIPQGRSCLVCNNDWIAFPNARNK